MQNTHNKANNKLEFKVRQQIKVSKIRFFFTFFVNVLILNNLFFDNNYHYNFYKALFMVVLHIIGI